MLTPVVSTIVSYYIWPMGFWNRLFGGKEEIVPASIYDVKAPGVTGGIIDFAAFRGKKILVVNTASKCGNTPQYEKLEQLYQANKERLVIIAFPANNFLFQEPGSNKKIAEFCSINYHISFPIAAKVSVKGWSKAAVYKWLTEKRYNGVMDSKVTWNFQKYLIDETGKLVAVFGPKTDPLGLEILDAINKKHTH